MKEIFTIFLAALCGFQVFGQLPSHIPTDSLIGWWPFSGNANDAGGNHINGTVNGAVYTIDRLGNMGSALSLDGENDWIDLGDRIQLNPGIRDITVSAWIKTKSSNGMRIYSKGTHGGSQPGYDIMIYPNSGGKAAVIYCPGNIGSTPYEKIVYSNSAVNDGSWHLITGVITRNGTVNLYVDGEIQAGQIDISSTSSVSIGLNTFNASIGASYCFNGDSNNLNEFFDGSIDQVGIWMRSLNECEIKSLFYETESDTTVSFTSCNCQVSPSGTYTWINSGIYKDTLANAIGCDSIITCVVTINHSNNGTDVVAACESYTWIDGMTYTSSNNTAMHTFTNTAGCDSVVTLNLTINNSVTGTDMQTACGSYTWIDGNTYTASNNSATYNIAGGAACGCDSLVTLNLTINNSVTGTDVQTACGSYTWIDGNTYTVSNNSATFNIAGGAVNGCDSLVTLNLTINSVDASANVDGTTVTANATGADYQWIDCSNGNVAIPGETNPSFVATSGGYYAVVVSQNGCMDTSDCMSVLDVRIPDNSFGAGLVVYPNPTSGYIHVDLGQVLEEVSVIIRNSVGQEVSRGHFKSVNFINQSIVGGPGVYFLEINANKGKAVFVKIKKR